MKRLLILLVLLCIPATTFAADPFKDIVRAIEKEYRVHHTGIPWFARVIIKPAMWGSGVSGLKLAEFENVSLNSTGSQIRLAEFVERNIGPEWQNIIRIRSRHANEITYIYMRPEGPRFTMLVVNVEPSEACVVQVKLKPSQLEKWTNDADDGTLAIKQIHRRRSGGTETATLISSDTPGGYSLLVP